MSHPFRICAMRHCCFCFYFDPETTCYIIAVICILFVGFSGVTNFGAGNLCGYLCSILNLGLHLSAGVLLFLGTLWGNRNFKLAYCWIIFSGIFTVSICYVLTMTVCKDLFIIWGPKCHNFDKTLSAIILILNAIWLMFWDIYTPMVVLGNLWYCEESSGDVKFTTKCEKKIRVEPKCGETPKCEPISESKCASKSESKCASKCDLKCSPSHDGNYETKCSPLLKLVTKGTPKCQKKPCGSRC